MVTTYSLILRRRGHTDAEIERVMDVVDCFEVAAVYNAMLVRRETQVDHLGYERCAVETVVADYTSPSFNLTHVMA